MSRAAYLREQAAAFRGLASKESSGAVREKLLALAKQCEQLAFSIDGVAAKAPGATDGPIAEKPGE